MNNRRKTKQNKRKTHEMDRLTEADRATCPWKCDDDAALAEVAAERDADAKCQSRTASALLAAIQRWPRRSVLVGHSVHCAGLLMWLMLLRPATAKTYGRRVPSQRSKSIRKNTIVLGNGTSHSRYRATQRTTVRVSKVGKRWTHGKREAVKRGSDKYAYRALESTRFIPPKKNI